MFTPASLGHSWKAPRCLFSRAVLNEAASSAGVSLVAVPCGVYESIFASLHSVIAVVVDRVDSIMAGIAGWGRAEGERVKTMYVWGGGWLMHVGQPRFSRGVRHGLALATTMPG